MNDKLLTMTVSNRDRFSPNSEITKLWIKSIQTQTDKNFDVLVVDGGSKNYNILQEYFNENGINCMQRVIEEKFHRGFLLNVGVRNAKTPYIMTSDTDMFYARDFFKTIISLLNPNVFIESRTLYWRPETAREIYSGKLDPFNDLQSCKIGRIKKRTTAGGCQCGHIDVWNKVGGFDERYIGWGSEDVDLLSRINMTGVTVKWLGESSDTVMLFHQPHKKLNYQQDMQDQYSNLKYYKSIKGFRANPNGWGDKK